MHTTPNKRLEYIDIIRGIAIILVVMGHLIQFNGIPTTNPVFEFIYSFHMPLFFAISGYITQKVTKIENLYQYFIFLKKKCISIALPLLTWSLVVDIFFLHEKWDIITIEDIKNILLTPRLWFLKMLFIILVYYGIYNLINNQLKKKNICTFIIAIFPVLLLTFLSVYLHVEEKNILMFSYSFYLGCIVSQYSLIEKMANTQLCYSISVIAFFILVSHWSFGGNFIDDIYKVIISTFAFLLLFNFCQKFSFPLKVGNLLQLFGKESLAIYIVQFNLCKLGITNLATLDIPPFILFIISLLIAIPICYICCFIAKSIYTNKFLSIFLLGKRNVVYSL